MKLVLYLSSTELYSQVIQALSDAQLLHKVELSTQPDSSQSKPLRLSGPTSIRTRDCHTERQADNTLVCSACGRKIPVTPQGDVDMEQIQREILLRQW